MAGRKRLTLFDKIFLGFMGVAVVVIAIVGIVKMEIQSREDQARAAYHETMAAVLDSIETSQVTGDKAVSYVMDDESGTYSTQYVPEELKTNSPDEVRYVIICKQGSELVGTYSNGGGTGHQRWCAMEVTDLKTGESMGQEEFRGSYPPSTVTSSGPHYGSYPDETAISQWAMSVIQGLITADEPATEPVTEAATEPAQTKPSATDKEDALETAQYYLGVSYSYSYSRLVEKLAEEGFTTAEAKEAVDQCGADWKERALAKATERISEYPGYSYNYLIYWIGDICGYTPEEAKYAADHCGADWNEQAVIAAQAHIDAEFGYSYDELIIWMSESIDMGGDGFTAEEAKYGADQCEADWFEEAAEWVASYLEYATESYTKDQMVSMMVEFFGFTEEQAIYGAEQNGLP